MKNNKGITLMMVIFTVMLLFILGGLILTNSIDTWKHSKVVKFKTNMQVLQKKVDIILESGINYSTLGASLDNTVKTKLQTIIESDTNNYIETSNVDATTLRYFSAEDIKNVFDIDGVQDEFVINFANREIISLNGVEQDGVKYYVENGL